MKNISLEKFRELHSKRKNKTLSPYEKQKIRYSLKNVTEENILIHLYNKFFEYGMNEFYQRKFDIKIEVGIYTNATITTNLNSLEKKGYFTKEFKRVKGKNYMRLHFNINIQKLNGFLTTGDDLKPEVYLDLIERFRFENEVTKKK